MNKRFYTALFAWFTRAVAEATFPTNQARTLPPEEHVIRLITRLLFVWFVKEKGLIAAELFTEAQVAGLLKDYDRDTGDAYYRAVVQNLFFATLNTEVGKRGFSREKRATHRDFSRYRYRREMQDPAALLALFRRTPFINGGLFDCLDSETATTAGGWRIDCFTDTVTDPTCREHGLLSIPNRLFFDADGLLTLFDKFTFTVEENTPAEQDVALAPELLGKVFENLLAAVTPETRETARKQTGSYYAPRAVVEYMVDEALVAALADRVQPDDGDAAFWQDRLRYLLDYADAFDDAEQLFTDAERAGVVHAVADTTVLDPAVGSGAFPMGVLHKLTLALRRLDPDNRRWEALQKERARARMDQALETCDRGERDAELLDISATFERYRDSDFGRKLYLIQNSIFGVDIQPVASQIAKLRFFISLAIEQEPTDDEAANYGIKPLPNLETRFVAANTLLGLDKPAQQTLGRTANVARLERALHENRERHFHATTRRTKTTYRKKDAKLRTELAGALRTAGFPAADAGKIAQWDPYDQNASADWFDAEYMFGLTTGFDVVLGNPPYISHDKIERDLKDKLRSTYQTYQSFADEYCYFIEKAVGLQSQSGVLSMITSNSYLRAEYGKPIRNFLKKHNYLLRVLSVEDSQVFDSAIVNIAIIVSSKSENHTDESCIVVNSPLSDENFREFVKDNSFRHPQHYFDSELWNLVDPNLAALQEKLKSFGKTLKQLGSKIRLGIATGSNEAFLINEAERKELCMKNSANAKIIKPILRGRDIARYHYTSSGYYILLAKNGINVRKTYPDIYARFQSFGDKFRNRGAKGQHWTNLRACSFYDDFKKEKIVWIELADSGRFALCNEEIYLLNSA